MSYKEAYVGRNVHYVARGSVDGKFAPECMAAIVTAIYTGPPDVSLAVLNPRGLFFDPHITWSPALGPDALVGGTWHEIEECRGDYLGVD